MTFRPSNERRRGRLAMNVVGAGRIIMPDGFSYHTGPFKRQFVILESIIIVSLRFTPPLFGLARMCPPKPKRFNHSLISSGSFTTAHMSSPKRAAHEALADRGILLTSVPLSTGCDTFIF